MVGSVVKLQAVWDFADIANALMAVPNLIALLGLNAVIVPRHASTSGKPARR